MAAPIRLPQGFRPPSGRILGVDVPGLVVIGPAGPIGASPIVVRTMQVLSQGGRHSLEALVAAVWRDEAHLREGMDAFAPKLAAPGLRICRRKAGWRITKALP